MTAQLGVIIALPAAGAVIAWICTHGYYRAAYGDRYQRGYADGQEAQIRAYQAARRTLPPWETSSMLPAPPQAAPAWSPHAREAAELVLGSWYPGASGPPRYAQLSPGQLDGGPPTSEWARDLIAGIERWNSEHLGNGGAPWPG